MNFNELAEIMLKLNICEDNRMIHQTFEIVEQIHSPLVELSSALVNFVQIDPQFQLDVLETEVKIALSSLRTVIEEVTLKLPQTGHSQLLLGSLDKLKAEISVFEESTHSLSQNQKNEKYVEDLISDILDVLQLSLNFEVSRDADVNSVECKVINEMRKLKRISEPISQLREGINKIKAIDWHYMNENLVETLNKLVYPLESLSLISFGLRHNTSQIEGGNEIAKISNLKLALSSLAETVQYVLSEIPESENSYLLTNPLNGLQIGINEIEKNDSKCEIIIKEPLVQEIITQIVQISSLATKIVFTDSTKPQKRVSCINKLFEFMNEFRESIETLEHEVTLDENVSELFENLRKFNEPLKQLSTALIKLTEKAASLEVQEVLSPPLKTALCSMKYEIENFQRNERKFAAILMKPLDMLREEILEIAKIDDEELAMNLHRITTVLLETYSIAENLKDIQPVIPRKGLLSIVKISKPMRKLKEGIESFHSLHQERDKNKDIMRETVKAFEKIVLPLQELSSALAKLSEKRTDTNLEKVVQPEVESALLVLKTVLEEIDRDFPEYQHNELLKNPLKKLVLSLQNIQTTQPEDNVKINLGLQISSNIEKIALYASKLEVKAGAEPQKGVFSIFEISAPLSELQVGIEALESLDEEVSRELIEEKLKEIDSPLQTVSSIMMSLCDEQVESRTEEVMVSKVQTSLSSLKEAIRMFEMNVPDVTHINLLTEPLKNLNAIISHIEETISPPGSSDEKCIARMIESIVQISSQTSKLEINSGMSAKQGILSIVEISEPLEMLKHGIENLVTSKADEKSKEAISHLDKITVPLENISAVLVELNNSRTETEIHNIVKPRLQSALSAFKEVIQKVEVNIPKSERSILILEPLHQLQGKISHIQESIPPKQESIVSEVAQKIIADITKITLDSSRAIMEASTKEDKRVSEILSISEPLNQLREGIVAVENFTEGDIAQSTQNILDNLADLEEPLEKLARNVPNLYGSTVEKSKETIVHIAEDLPALKEAIEMVKMKIIEHPGSQLITTPLIEVQCQVSHIDKYINEEYKKKENIDKVVE
ncbi:hypothetical protein WA026_018452 [Henosepilachna vigintioctopunctata]|uniref:Uncharacterized protein n=1 Tax=Henosepilachna vigintioctopunctata TaxID=420089 RepID=A0AAW1V4J9_9CUCU